MKTLLIVIAVFGHSALALSRSDRSASPKKHKYDSDEDYSDTDEDITPPKTSFSCEGKIDGFYADIENKCKSFHYCQTFVFPDDDPERKDWIFICPPPTIFRQQYLTCSNPHKSFRCEDSEQYFDVNEELPPVQPGEEPTLPPPESDTTDPPIEEETTKPPTPPPTKPPKPKPKPTTSTTPLPTEEPTTEETTEPETPDNSNPEESDDTEKKGAHKKPEGSFLLPPYKDPHFSVSPFLSLIPTFHSGLLGGKGSEKVNVNLMTKDKVNLANPLTLDEFLKKTSWESFEKKKETNKWTPVTNLLKAPLVFPSSFIPHTPLPLLKVVNEQVPALFSPQDFDEFLFRYNGQVISDKDEPIGPR